MRGRASDKLAAAETSDFFLLELSDDVLSLEEVPDDESDEPDEDDDSATFFLEPLLKSVSYQPPPFRRNAAAETSFVSSGLEQDGQSFNGSSLIFCNFSSL